MWKRITVIAAWVIATFATAAITLAAVGQAGHEVSDRPAMPVSAAELNARVGGQGSATTQGSVSAPGPTTTTSSTTTSTTTPQSGSTTTAGQGSLVASDSETTGGGTVTVTAVGGSLALSSAIPAQGFVAKTDLSASGEIAVTFTKHDGSVTYFVRATLEGGSITWEVEVSTTGG